MTERVLTAKPGSTRKARRAGQARARGEAERLLRLLAHCPACGAHSSPSAHIVAERKGHVLMEEVRPTFGEAAIGLGWHILTANEGREIDWHHLTDAQEKEHCQQVGCAEAPVNVYRLKKLQVHPGESLMLEPQYDFTGQYAWYCARHTTRGDCGLEDCDKNLELVSGPGTGSPHAEDESPAAVRVLRTDVGEG